MPEASGRSIVSWRNGSPVRLEEIGTVFDSVESDKTITWRNNVRSIVLAIQRQPGTNTVAVVNEIRKLLPVFEKQLPAAVQLSVMIDRSESIRDSVNDVKFTLTLTI